MRPDRRRTRLIDRNRSGVEKRGGKRRRRRGKKKGFFHWLFRALLLLCIVSASPMLALRFFDPPTSSFIELNKLNHNKNIKHEWRSLDEISAYFPVAVIASEDQQFPSHFGFDLKQIKLVLAEREKGLSRGASTITQQTIKNLFLWPERSLLRKGIEAWLAIWMEMIVSKRRILELYVNFAQFGKSVFGVEAASQYYFGIPAAELNAHQSALIAASLPTPSRSNPANPSEYLQKRAAFIEDQMPRIGGRRLISEL
ncbi:MAG: monofunctional biosynthetic peptidoglycan transglycosylase [Gammaproteobacteria bacterium]|nr:monofunctional biosynthetic peptidoglycan transglycosylase [Gammaproteobacteria bacterium]